MFSASAMEVTVLCFSTRQLSQGFMACDIAFTVPPDIENNQNNKVEDKEEKKQSGELQPPNDEDKCQLSSEDNNLESKADRDEDSQQTEKKTKEEQKRNVRGIRPKFAFPVTAVCMYMGGLGQLQMVECCGITPQTLPPLKEVPKGVVRRPSGIKLDIPGCTEVAPNVSPLFRHQFVN